MEGMAGKPSLGELINLTLAGLRDHVLPCAAAVVALVAINVAVDLALGESGANVVSGLLSVVVQMVFMRAILAREGLPNGDQSYGSLFGMSLMANIAIAVGMVLLIIPGLYLMARWFIAGPLIFAEERTAGGSLSRSWEMTEDSAWTLVGLYLLVMTPPILAVVGAATLGEVMGWWLESSRQLLAGAFVYTCLFAGGVATWIAEIAAYRALSGGGGHRVIGEVFV